VSESPSGWHEVVLEGREVAVRAFVTGFLAGFGGRGGGVFGADVGLEPESLGARVRELFSAGTHHVFFAPTDLVAALADAVEEHGADVGVRFESRRLVASASFEFRAETFNRESARAIRSALLSALPPGAQVEDAREQEEARPEARGVELYAPEHDYVWRASGRVVGAIPAVLEVRRRATTLELVETGPFRVTAG
jgi:hypothetical protein